MLNKESLSLNGYLGLSDGKLYKQLNSNNLIWSTTTGDFNLTKSVDDIKLPLYSTNSGTMLFPSYTFLDDTSTGIYKPINNILGITAGGVLGLSVSSYDTTIYKTLVIKDSNVSAPVLDIEGHLYKKPNDNGLYWNTTEEIDLTQVRFPLLADNGSYSQPSYSFVNESNSGFYKLNEGGIGLSINGSLHSYNNLVSGFMKPLELNDVTASNASITPIDNTSGKLYKKVSSSGLYWNTLDGGEIDITNNKLDFPILGKLGSNVKPTYSFSGDDKTGIYNGGT